VRNAAHAFISELAGDINFWHVLQPSYGHEMLHHKGLGAIFRTFPCSGEENCILQFLLYLVTYNDF